MKDRERLLAELDEAPWFAMRQLADLALEQGDCWLARGWQWLAEHHKWPACLEDRWGWLSPWKTGSAAAPVSAGAYLPQKAYHRVRGLVPPTIGRRPGTHTTLSVVLLAAAQAMAEMLREEAEHG